jgi:hypothetical protein
MFDYLQPGMQQQGSNVSQLQQRLTQQRMPNQMGQQQAQQQQQRPQMMGQVRHKFEFHA